MAFVDQRNRAAARCADAAVVWLDEPEASDPAVAGSKAANLARAADEGLPTVDGFAVTVNDVRLHPTAPSESAREAWARLTRHGTVPVVVRSSSTVEDLDGSSMAGLFTSVVDVRGWQQFVDAYGRVAGSARGSDMAVLVQRLLRPSRGGVLFGVDPVSGRTDRMVIAAVSGGPDQLVSGEVQGRRIVVTPSGRVESADGDQTPVLSRRERRRLIGLASRAWRIFGGPQDIEWAFDGGSVLLLQSRPVTATAEPGQGPLLGQGTVAETFPGPLSTLATDLWLPPLRDAITETLRLTGSAGRRRIARSPVLTAVHGYAVVDLELIGAAGGRSRLVEAIDPRGPLRRLAASWRVGRLRGALPQLSTEILTAVDRELAALPDISFLDDDELLRILRNVGPHLRALHGHEMLVGSLLQPDGLSAAGVALRQIVDGRARGWTDDDILARAPEVLALVAPSLGPRAPLPNVDDAPVAASSEIATREQLRLRVRWVHELTRQVVRELGRRLAERGALDAVDDVDRLSHEQLEDVVLGKEVAVPGETIDVRTAVPTRFRLSAGGAVVSETSPVGDGGVGASGGRGRGPVVHADPAPGDVLVVHSLDPALAPFLTTVGGVVAETGSPLSHLAILARERKVPVVVGYADAQERLPTGSTVSIDGTTGEVELVADAGALR